MANSALARIETALRERKLDRTLTTALAPLERSDAAAFVPFAVEAIDAVLRGGLPRGQVSEIAGPPSSGRTTLLLQLLRAATRGEDSAATRGEDSAATRGEDSAATRGGERAASRGGEIAALVDTCDRFDVASAAAAAIDLDRLLWIRGEIGSPDRVVERAIKALTLVLQAGGFAIVAIDLADVHPRVLRSLPFTTWLRLQRIVEGSDTACLLLTPEPLARSAGGLTVMCTGQTTWSGATQQTQSGATQQTQSGAIQQTQSGAIQQTQSGATRQTQSGAIQQTQSGATRQTGHSHRVTGLEIEIRVVSPRRRVDGDARVAAVAADGPWR
jgi:hypothetical protein